MIISTKTAKLKLIYANGSIIEDNTYYLSGDTITLECEDGLYGIAENDVDEVALTTSLRCDTDGTWNNGAVSYFGTCKEITCDASSFQNLTNGVITHYRNVYQFQEVMMLECDKGFRPYTNRIIMKCLTDDDFKNQNFKCEPITCLTPPDPIHGRLDTTKLYYFPYDAAEFSCDYGYTMVGSFVWKCQSSGEWDHSCVQCVREETTACDPGWMQHGDSCYFVEIHNHKHWFGAKRWCESQNGYLAAIANYDENEFLKTQLRRLAPTVHIWLGGTDIAAEHNWVWAHTWEPFGFSDWNTGEPNNAGGQEDCLTYLVGLYLWNDLWCGSELAYICEKPLHPGLLIG